MRLRNGLSISLSLAFFLCLLFGFAVSVRTWLPGVCNSAGPWGIRVPDWVMIFGFVAVSLVFFRELSQKHDKVTLSLWLLLIAAGGSNLMERLFLGCVYDYLSVPLFPVFNLPDAILTLSVVFLMVKGFRD